MGSLKLCRLVKTLLQPEFCRLIEHHISMFQWTTSRVLQVHMQPASVRTVVTRLHRLDFCTKTNPMHCVWTEATDVSPCASSLHCIFISSYLSLLLLLQTCFNLMPNFWSMSVYFPSALLSNKTFVFRGFTIKINRFSFFPALAYFLFFLSSSSPALKTVRFLLVGERTFLGYILCWGIPS